MKPRPVAAIVLAAVLSLVVRAQDTFKVNVEAVQVYATVTDAQGRFVTGLKAANFKVFEDGKEQQVQAFSSDDSPLSVGMLFDVSGDTGSNIPLLKQAALGFLKAGNLRDEYFLMEFNDKPRLVEDYTQNLAKLEDYKPALHRSPDDGVFDAIYAGLDRLRHASNPRKVLIVFTSGGHLQSAHRAVEVRNLARQLDVQIYGVTIVEMDFHGTVSGLDTGLTVLDSVGGQTFAPDSGADFINTCRKIAVGLRNQYIMAYTSTNPVHDGKYRHLRVQLDIPGAPELAVQTRNGYYSREPSK